MHGGWTRCLSNCLNAPRYSSDTRHSPWKSCVLFTMKLTNIYLHRTPLARNPPPNKSAFGSNKFLEASIVFASFICELIKESTDAIIYSHRKQCALLARRARKSGNKWNRAIVRQKIKDCRCPAMTGRRTGRGFSERMRNVDVSGVSLGSASIKVRRESAPLKDGRGNGTG